MQHLPLQQSPAFARALRAYGATVVSDAPVVVQRRFGPLGTVRFASRVDAAAVLDSPVQVLNAETDTPSAFCAAGYRQLITPVHVAEWDLTVPDLTATLHPKWRNQWRKGCRQACTVRSLVWDGTPHALFARADALARARRFRAMPTALLSAYAQANHGQALILEAEVAGSVEAACLILCHGATASYQTAWASAAGFQAQAPRLLLMQAAQHLAERGHTRFDLGLVETERSRGLARFKLGTGAGARSLGGTWVRLRRR